MVNIFYLQVYDKYGEKHGGQTMVILDEQFQVYYNYDKYE